MIIKPRIEVVFPKFGYHSKSKVKDNEFGDKQSWLLDSGRSAIYLALQALKLSPGSMVGVMAYNCHSVADMVAAAGLQPVFIDVTKNLRIDIAHLKQKTPQIQALIVSHLFGLENDVREIRKACPSIPIIEDCAHAAGITTCGQSGDMAIYSVGRGKLPSIADGGILVCNNSQYADSIDTIYNILPCYTAFQEMMLMLKSIVYAVAYTPFVYTLFTHRIASRKKRYAKIMQSEYKPRQMSRITRRLLDKAVKSLPQQVHRRGKNSIVAQSIVQRIAPDAHFVSHNSGNHFMDIYLCDNPVKLRLALRKMGVDSATHFGQSVEWNQRYGQVSSECTTSEWLSHHLLAIPTYISWNEVNTSIR
ncbi:MAG: DegT/DnrJ/EryC1/StrS family aminotransferase [Bacteroidales bacterium]|nr:DegT/DnrJ/EryC1/StrS family aminotransferase [Bacteroidales bacterium]MBR1799450.1 DegT/DnrJ/EryC1/StrS family aminotransferase [Bacteroidales bacterium]